MRQKRAPGCNRFSHCLLALSFQISLLCVGSYEKRQLYLGHMFEHGCMPERRAFQPGRRIPSVGVASRVTESHGYNGNACLIIKVRLVEREPVAQTITTAIIPGNTAFVDPCAGRLTDNRKSRGWRSADNGPWSKWKMLRTNFAGSNLLENVREVVFRVNHDCAVSR